MLEILEKAAMTALGAAALTQKKGEELVKELKAQYKISEEEGRAFLDRLQELARTGREKTQEMAETEVKKATDRFGLVTREEFEKLEQRVKVLEAIAPASDEEAGD